MKILLITYSFPPAAGVGVHRALSLAKYLPASGLDVHVLTAKNAAAVGQDSRPLATLPPSVSIHRTWTADLPFGVRKALKRLMSKRSGATGALSSAPSRSAPAPLRRDNVLKRLVANLLLPDPQVGWLPFALRAANRLIRSDSMDLVLVTVPPFSAARLVTKLRRRNPGLPIVLDFRDEWLTSTINLVSFNNNARALRIARSTEKDAVAAATSVVCATEAAVREISARYPEQPREKFHCIPNGFDTPVPTEAEVRTRIKEVITQTNDQIVLTYLGSVYGSTDPGPVIEAVKSLEPAVRSRLLLRFVGHIEDERYRQHLLELGAQVELIGFVPHAEALRYMGSTTYLLLITHDPINVSAKLYDYLGAGLPILAAVNKDGDVYRIIQETHSGWAADIASPSAIKELLENAVGRAKHLDNDFVPDVGKIARFHRSCLAERYAALLKTSAGKATS